MNFKKSYAVQYVPRSITVLSPNGGETWKMWGTYDITWKTVGLDEVAVWLQHSQGDLTHGCRLIPASRWTLDYAKNGRYSWTIGKGVCSVSPGDKFKILIWESGDTPQIQDTSDDYFSITD